MKKWQRWAVRGIALTAGCLGLFWSTTTASANAINTYIANQQYATPKITKNIWPTFPKNSYRNGKPEGVVVHETANPNSTIYGEISYMKSNYQSAFVHTFVDAAVSSTSPTRITYAGSRPVPTPATSNSNKLKSTARRFASELNNAAYYTAYILNQYGL